jgi:hypothetical protein
MKNMEKLLAIASGPLGERVAMLPKRVNHLAGGLANQLLQMLSARNGFYAFEQALHVFPVCANDSRMDMEAWNAESSWRAGYPEVSSEGLFFAEDLFGGQFCIRGDRVFTFDPETGDMEFFAADLDEWAEALLADYEVLTGCSLAKQWQAIHGRIPEGHRLLPKRPFVMGGDFAPENLYACDAVEGMKFRAEVASQIRDLPDGSEISIHLSEDS